MSNKVKIELWDLQCIETYQDVVNAYLWCCDNYGNPGRRWQYGKSQTSRLGDSIISTPSEITYLVFHDHEDALQFKLTFS